MCLHRGAKESKLVFGRPELIHLLCREIHKEGHILAVRLGRCLGALDNRGNKLLDLVERRWAKVDTSRASGTDRPRWQ